MTYVFIAASTAGNNKDHSSVFQMAAAFKKSLLISCQ